MTLSSILKNKYFPIILGFVIITVTSIILFYPSHKIDSQFNSVNTEALDAQISKQKSSIKTNPKKIDTYFLLSDSYLQKIRETSDASYYQKIQTLMDSALKIEAENPDIFATRASVFSGLHHFKEAKIEINKAIAINPHRDRYYGILTDCNIELGEYDEAVINLQKMVDMRPSFSSFSRVAYVRELYGDVPGAEKALISAITFGSAYKENIAWAYVELGKLAMRKDLDKATADFNQALKIVPTYSQAMEGLGKVAFAKGDIESAEKNFKDAFVTLPLALYSLDLADVYTYKGDGVKSKQYQALAQASFDTARTAGVDTNLEESLFLSEHQINGTVSVTKAQIAYKERPNIYAADALAYAYYANNQMDKALEMSPRALSLGETDPLILLHQAIIFNKSGNNKRAKELIEKINTKHPYIPISSFKDFESLQKTLSVKFK